MSDQIVSVEDIQRRARAAHAAGQSAEDCPYNWHSCAYTTWQAEFARLDLEQTCEEQAG